MILEEVHYEYTFNISQTVNKDKQTSLMIVNKSKARHKSELTI